MMRPFRFFAVAAAGPVGPGEIVDTARRAEAAGFAGLVLPDHLVKQHAPIPVLATVAAATQRLRIMPFVLNTGLRHPAVVAQDLASLDVLSGGRLEIGLGAGWNRAEHDAIGLPFEPAGRRIDRLAEAVDVLKGCFAPGPLSYQGNFYTLDQHDGYPKPVQQPHPPLFIGGGGRRVLTLAGRHANTVGLAPRVLPSRDGITPPDPYSLTLAAAEEKVAWVRAAAGDRFDRIELNLYPSGGPLLVTSDPLTPARERADRLRRLTGVELSTTEILQSPHVFIGSVAELVDKIQSLRARLGVSSFMLGDVDAAAPIVERLAGVSDSGINRFHPLGDAVMTTTLTRQDMPAVTTTQQATQREDLIGVLFGIALVGGALADAWAHTNLSSTLESFFTPWHALLYTGFAGAAAWTWWLAFRHRSQNARWWANAWPAGYKLGAIGSVMFLVGGAADMFWHQIFGVETSLRITMSPSHMTLAAGGALLLTSQMRSWWASGEGGLRAVTGVLSASLGTMLGVLLILGMTGANTIAPTIRYVAVTGGGASNTDAARGIQAYLIGTVVMLIPVLLMLRRRSTPLVATGVAGVIGAFLIAQREFPLPLSAALIGMVVGAIIADTIVYRLDLRRGFEARGRLPIAGAIIAGSLWAGHLIGLQIADGIRWPVELWAGVVVLTSALGALLGTGFSAPANQQTQPGTSRTRSRQ